jgi:hypothetical protein
MPSSTASLQRFGLVPWVCISWCCRTASTLWFVYVDITRERDGKRDRAGKVTTVAKGNLSACEMKEDGQLAFLLN